LSLLARVDDRGIHAEAGDLAQTFAPEERRADLQRGKDPEGIPPIDEVGRDADRRRRHHQGQKAETEEEHDDVDHRHRDIADDARDVVDVVALEAVTDAAVNRKAKLIATFTPMMSRIHLPVAACAGVILKM
jgi:hypothetical protein